MSKIVGYGEILLRNTILNNNLITQEDNMIQQVGGAEFNVLVGMQNLGHQSTMISSVANNPLGDKVINFVRKNNIEYNNVTKSEGRIGQYYLEVGMGQRASRVTYDRSDSVFSKQSLDEEQIKCALKDADVFHFTGITLALSKICVDNTMKILKYCKENNIMVSMDFNYRAKLWSVEDATDIYRKVLEYVDVLFASKYDLDTFLIQKDFASVMKENNIKYIFHTLRNNISSNRNGLTAYGYSSTDSYISDYTEFDILDRIGGGDAFVVGVLDALLNKEDLENIVEQGLICGVLKHSINGDQLLTTKEQVSEVLKNKGKLIVNR